jgi:hypothetical protein
MLAWVTSLYSNRRTLSKKRICVSVVRVLRCREAANKVVSITAIVTGALNLAKMGHLMENRSGLFQMSVRSSCVDPQDWKIYLVLSMALAAQRSETIEK